jgi:hypothetical protein
MDVEFGMQYSLWQFMGILRQTRRYLQLKKVAVLLRFKNVCCTN